MIVSILNYMELPTINDIITMMTISRSSEVRGHLIVNYTGTINSFIITLSHYLIVLGSKHVVIKQFQLIILIYKM